MLKVSFLKMQIVPVFMNCITYTYVFKKKMSFIISSYLSQAQFLCSLNVCICLTGLAKTIPNGTRTEIQFYNLRLMLHSNTIYTHQTHGYRRPIVLSQTAFWCACQTMKVHDWACGTSERFNKDCQQQPLFLLWIVSVSVTYFLLHGTAACLLMTGITCLQQPPTPPLYMCHLWYYSSCAKVTQNLALLAR